MAGLLEIGDCTEVIWTERYEYQFDLFLIYDIRGVFYFKFFENVTAVYRISHGESSKMFTSIEESWGVWK